MLSDARDFQILLSDISLLLTAYARKYPMPSALTRSQLEDLSSHLSRLQETHSKSDLERYDQYLCNEHDIGIEAENNVYLAIDEMLDFLGRDTEHPHDEDNSASAAPEHNISTKPSEGMEKAPSRSEVQRCPTTTTGACPVAFASTEVTNTTGTRHGERKTFLKKPRSARIGERKRNVAHMSTAYIGQSHAISRADVSTVLKLVSSPPEIDPWSIYSEFKRHDVRCGTGFDHNRLYLLTKLFYAIGSPDAFSQLRDTSSILRTRTISLHQSSQDLNGTIAELDQLEASVHASSVLRRYHLVHLYSLRQKLQAQRGQNSKRLRPDREIGRTSGHTGSQILAKIMVEAYPDVKATRQSRTKGKDEYGRKLQTLKGRLLAGHRWSTLAHAFAPGILALMPTQGDYQVTNSDYEKLPAPAIDMLIQVLIHHRSSFLQQVSKAVSSIASSTFLQSPKYFFETQDRDMLKVEKYDSARLIELCSQDTMSGT
ncbi:hypothetical protein EJ05DRAFT_320606 [Pseudovirgaria hyperparasitica]|uniref:Uncharacterized protein n=1 Tax=Pseudovirgaria hyperparasitica TaxID=470096 RepID=A0A6A6VRG7_9PEZI|nr:uncharacterized protein EJ05DRAFT_320606 [Pseudovirgaria hyperparasitica]KAF2752499.1 hypothetical protein EJ05DRAFT_320606 [Pseudovirgaria hyperparasitica]